MPLTAVVAVAGILLLGSAGTTLAQQSAIVVFNVGGNGIAGTVKFEERAADCAVAVVGSISGLRPNAAHGLHVHAYGDVSNGCESTGGHWNPLNATHGDLDADPSHAGDLGNVRTDGAGVAQVNLTSRSIARAGFASLLGRALVIHNGTDDLGLGNASSSTVTGNSGARLACGVIGVAIGRGSTPATTATVTSCGGTARADQTTASASAQSSNAAATVPSSAASVTAMSLPNEANSAGQSSSDINAIAFGSSPYATATMSITSSGHGGKPTSTHLVSQPSVALSVLWTSASFSPSNGAHSDRLTDLVSRLYASLALVTYMLNRVFEARS